MTIFLSDMTNDKEIAAVIALALQLCSYSSEHDKEPETVTFDIADSDWRLKSLTFRKSPCKK